ncbi:hypothetical protein FHR24_001272 [Wenyingzhuangia heitensis]|uniref:Sialate O-acetylesterase domain-containing protein n=1 Tax=Wenyingzhuangia heitensis TaxID=1487859 RepID=A0ABX0U7K4_9FLAO|nr:sialate O-acetylesterase [Wenyingzhuangia heitensis]NIJ44833.1 hypothetical protein [Wenyingzhuangia heitensis]
MQTKTKFIGFFLLLFILFGYAQKNTVKVILLAGQSNIQGHGDYDLLEDSVKQRIQKIAHRVYLSTSDNSKIEPKPLSYYTQNDRRGKYNFQHHFGPEIFVGLTMAEAYPNQQFLLIKKAVGGTSLHGAWSANWTQEKANVSEIGAERKALQLYKAHLKNIESNLNRLKQDGKSYQIIGLAWMQGEADTNSQLKANNYQQNLENLIAAYRAELGKLDFPFVIGQINVLPRKYKQGPTIVRKAMETVANKDTNVALIKTSTNPSWLDYPKHSDNIHYNTEGQKRLGTDFGKRLIEFIK